MQCSICKKECLESELENGICKECLEKEKKRKSTDNNKVLDKVMFGGKSKSFEGYNSIAKHWIWLSKRINYCINTIVHYFSWNILAFNKHSMYFNCNTKLIYCMVDCENNR